MSCGSCEREIARKMNQMPQDASAAIVQSLFSASVCRLRAMHRAAASAERSGNQERDTTVSQPAINRSWATTKAL